MVSNSGDLDGTRVCYYNGQQIIETRDGSGNMVSQVYHGTRYIDEVVGLRLPDGRAYVHQGERSEREPAADQTGRKSEQGCSRQAGEPARRKPRTMRAPGGANYNVIGLTDLTGRVLERYYYSPYGELEVAFDAHFFDYNDSGEVDEQDLAAATSGGECWGDYSGDCRRLDADADRDIDADDYTAISAYIDGLAGDQVIQRTPAPTRSQLGNVVAHQGLVFDPEIGSYQNRHRQYNPKLKRFMQRDPAALPWLRFYAYPDYLDGVNLYAYDKNAPQTLVDPYGAVPNPILEIAVAAQEEPFWNIVHCSVGLYLGAAGFGEDITLKLLVGWEEFEVAIGWSEGPVGAFWDIALALHCYDLAK